jgi:hypothetical protein
LLLAVVAEHKVVVALVAYLLAMIALHLAYYIL